MDWSDMVRFTVALFVSGIFWMMVLLLIEQARRKRQLPATLLMATLVLALSAWALFRVVVDDGLWKMTASQADTHQ
jgi:hypothetical protein